MFDAQARLFAGNLLYLREQGWRTFINIPFMRQLGARLYELLPPVVNLDMKEFQPVFNHNKRKRFQ
jgi:hypothetical protein